MSDARQAALVPQHILAGGAMNRDGAGSMASVLYFRRSGLGTDVALDLDTFRRARPSRHALHNRFENGRSNLQGSPGRAALCVEAAGSRCGTAMLDADVPVDGHPRLARTAARCADHVRRSSTAEQMNVHRGTPKPCFASVAAYRARRHERLVCGRRPCLRAVSMSSAGVPEGLRTGTEAGPCSEPGWLPQ